ncbi:MAG: hypothetical protein WCE79_06040 [Xanthobacteraceae bacterium]
MTTNHPMSVQKCEFVRRIGSNTNFLFLTGEISINGQVKKPATLQLGVDPTIPGVFAAITPADQPHGGETVVRSVSNEEKLFSLASVLLSDIPKRQFSVVVSTDGPLDATSNLSKPVKDIEIRVSRDPS